MLRGQKNILMHSLQLLRIALAVGGRMCLSIYCLQLLTVFILKSQECFC